MEAKPSSTVQGKTASLMAYLQGLLVVQDVQMASLMAFMPFFSGTSTSFFSSLVHLMQVTSTGKG